MELLLSGPGPRRDRLGRLHARLLQQRGQAGAAGATGSSAIRAAPRPTSSTSTAGAARATSPASSSARAPVVERAGGTARWPAPMKRKAPAHQINDRLVPWASDVDPETVRQARRRRLPSSRAMSPSCPTPTSGMGATVGSVIPTSGAVIPAAVGVDIGCGMIAAEPRRHRAPAARHPRPAAAPGSSGPSRPASVRATRRPPTGPTGSWPSTARPPTLSSQQAVTAAEAVRHARVGQPLRRGVPRRARPGVGRPPLRQPGHRQPAGPAAHRRGPHGWPRTSSSASRTPTSPTSSRARRVRRLHHRHALGPGLRPGQPGPDDGPRPARGHSRSSATATAAAGRPAASTATTTSPSGRSPRRPDAVDHPQGRHQGRRRRPRRHPRLHGHPLLHRPGRRATPRAGVVLPRRRPSPQPDRRPRSGSPPPTWTRRWRARCGCSDRADVLVDEIPAGLQGHRPGHGRPVRPGRGPPHPPPGPELQGT